MSNNNFSEPTITRKYYDESYYQKHETRLKQNDRFTKVKVGRVVSLLDPQKGELICDLGSGVGTIMIALAQREIKTIGIDYSTKSLEIAQSNFKNHLKNATFRGLCSDGRNIAFKDCSIDKIAAVDFTEHLDDDFLIPTIGEVFRILKKGGVFAIYTPSVTHVFERLKKKNIILREDKSHIGLRKMNDYIKILTEAGFAIDSNYFAPTDIPGFNLLETACMSLPLIGDLAKRRICIRAIKK